MSIGDAVVDGWLNEIGYVDWEIAVTKLSESLKAIVTGTNFIYTQVGYCANVKGIFFLLFAFFSPLING